MSADKLSKRAYLLAIIFVCPSVAVSWAPPIDPQGKLAKQVAVAPPPISSGNFPDDIQLVNANANPTVRIPVSHSSLNWTLIKPRIRASYGWLEIDRAVVRYNLERPSRITKEPDQPFSYSRSEVIDVKFEYGAAEFRASGLRHFFGYAPPNHWDEADSNNSAAANLRNADNAYTGLILRTLQSFDTVVADLSARQQAAMRAQVVAQPQPAPPPAPVRPPTPPTLVIVAPATVSDNQTVEINESTLTIRGVAMDDSGLPTVTINGTIVALRPKGDKVAEFWSDPIILKPGANRFEIAATSPAKATSSIQFVAQFTPTAAPVDPRALDKQDIISLLQGGVPDAHVCDLVRNRGIKFNPAPSDLNDIRVAGGSEDLLQAVKQAAAAK